MNSKLLGFLLALVCAAVAFHFATSHNFENPYPLVCHLVQEKIYLDRTETEQWFKTCLRRSRLVTPYSSQDLILKDINNILALLKLSHLEIFSPSEVREIWQGQNLTTGIDSEFVESELVIFKVQPHSPAAAAGLRRGDVIQKINGEHPNPWAASGESGLYSLRNSSGEREVHLTTAEVQRDEQMTLDSLGAQNYLLRVPSFRAEFFSNDRLQELQKKWPEKGRILVDLRGNSGGNFVAGLRLLSLFLCEPTKVGRLLKPRFLQDRQAVLQDDLDDLQQLALLQQNREVILKTFSSKSCFRGSVKVLLDGKTASVAEMVAQALKEERQALLLGAPSQGELLVGVWYPLDELGRGVQISIPEAVYVSQQGRRIEGEGVSLDKVLYYDLDEMQSGQDSWVIWAMKSRLEMR